MPVTSPSPGCREQAAREGDHSALAALLQEDRASLRRWIERHLDRRLSGKLSASDIVQDVYLDAERRLAHFGTLGEMPFGVWVRLLARQRLVDLYRRYFVARARDAAREVSIAAGSGSEALAGRLAGNFTTPSRVAIRRESADELRRAMDRLEPNDREILVLRHFESLSNDDVAARLGLNKSAATKRYIRALARLKAILQREPGTSREDP